MTFYPDPPTDYRHPRRLPTIITPRPGQITDQAELRDRRRKSLPLRYGQQFSMAREVGDITAPLAADLATLPDPAARGLRRLVEDVADAVHEIVSLAVGMVAESSALMDADDGARSRTAQAIRDLAVRPRAPELTDKHLADGTWPRVLVALADPVSADLAAVLGRAAPPGDERLHGRPSATERLNTVLLVLDGAAVQLTKAIPAFRRQQTSPSFAETQDRRRQQREAAAVQRRLARLGVR